MVPLIIEAALNGGTPKSRQPHTPKTPDEIAADSLAALAAGAGVVHTHIQGYTATGDAAAQEYWAGWAPVL
ncbi:MAG TPA: 3-keto-5-aminohexanoate cleavage protein, partial [Phenylobacterium sp.]|nr:3-keto-5-aminohexanoate cleavage protein [Phenylobacterium sp.]